MACDTSIRCGSTKAKHVSMQYHTSVRSINEAVSHMLVAMVILFSEFSLGDV